jgi:hypothetical protein
MSGHVGGEDARDPDAHQRQRWIARRRGRFVAASLRREACIVEVWW